jgi:hypothetical protein
MSLLLVGVCGILTGERLHAQLPQTRLHAVYPAGCQAGQTVDVRLTAGEDLEEISGLLFSHPGITAVQKQNEQGQPLENLFQVSVSADVPVGLYEVRCQGLFGTSNPRRFVVGTRPELLETETNDPTPAKAMPIELNTVVNGRMDGGTDIDWFRFSGRQGQSVTFDLWGERLDSKIDATLAVFDAAGRRQLQVVRDTVGNDPVLIFTPPADGEYLLKLHDHLFRNGNDYGYRLEAHTGPHILAVHPAAGLAGHTARFTLYGVNLPGGEPTGVVVDKVPLQQRVIDIAVPAQGELPDLEGRVRSAAAGTAAFAYRLPPELGGSNPVRIGVASYPVVLEQEPNDEPAQAQLVSVPSEVAGSFGSVGDSDRFRFQARAGDVLWMEVIGQRGGAAVDPQFHLDRVAVDGNGQESLNRITAADDDGTNALPNVFDTRSDDPRYRLVVPEDGLYQVTVRDRYWETRGNLTLVYRLVIRPETPGFQLVAVPAAPTPGQIFPLGLRQGDSFGLNIVAYREDGFEGPIDVRAVDLPPGVRCAGTTISSKENAGLLVFESTVDAPAGWHRIQLIGTARIDDPVKVRAEEAALKALPEAEKPLPELAKKLNEARQKLEQPQQQLAAAQQALAEKPEDEGLKKQVEQKQQAVDQALQQVEQAQAQLTAQEQAVAKAREAIQAAAAARQESVQTVERSVRAGTVVWPAANNVPALARVAEGVELSIMPEPAQYQVQVAETRFEAHQGRQLLVPLAIERRQEFTEKVQLTAVGMPKPANIDTPNIAFEKDQTTQHWRLLVKDNAPPGTYTVWLTAQAQVPYRRNPAKAERLKAALTEYLQQLEALKGAAAAATEAKNNAVAAVNTSQQQLQQAQQTQQAKQQALQQAQEQLKAAQAQLEQATAELNAATDDDRPAREQARQQAAEAVTTAEAAAKQAEAELLAATQATATAETALKTAQETQKQAEEAEKAAAAAVTKQEQGRAAVEKAATDAENAAKPKNLNFTPPTAPVVIVVHPAPVKLTAEVPNGGNLKPGEPLEVKVKIARQNGFVGPVTLTLPAVPGGEGISAEPVVIPADQSEGVLPIRATEAAQGGAVPLAVIRGEMEFAGQAAVDVPVTLNVNK